MHPIIRLLKKADIPQILKIYHPYVTDTSVTFEFDPPDLEIFTNRVEQIIAKYPYLVCEQAGELVGYAYASQVRSRMAYQWGAELSVYLAPKAYRHGIGSALYETLFTLLAAQKINMVYGCIAVPNPSSEQMHENLNFEKVGLWKKSGYQHGLWCDVVWYQKQIGECPENPDEPLCFTQLSAEFVQITLQKINEKLAHR